MKTELRASAKDGERKVITGIFCPTGGALYGAGGQSLGQASSSLIVKRSRSDSRPFTFDG